MQYCTKFENSILIFRFIVPQALSTEKYEFQWDNLKQFNNLPIADRTPLLPSSYKELRQWNPFCRSSVKIRDIENYSVRAVWPSKLLEKYIEDITR